MCLSEIKGISKMNFKFSRLRRFEGILLPLCVVLLSGCYKDSKMTNPYILAKLYREQNEKQTPKMAPLQMPYIDAAGSAEAFGHYGLGISSTNFTKVQNHEQDFIVKADVY